MGLGIGEGVGFLVPSLALSCGVVVCGRMFDVTVNANWVGL